MKKLTITKDLRTFNELSTDLQLQAIEKNRECFMYDTDYYMNDFIENTIVPMLNDKGFLTHEKNIEYDVNYVQGRGACFTCKDFEFNLLLENLNIPHKKWIIDILNSGYVECECKKRDFHYSHENTVRFNLYFYDTGHGHKRIDKMLFDTIEDYIENIRYDLCIDMCKELTDNYEYYFSDDFIKSEFIENNVYFDSDLKPYWNESENDTNLNYNFE